MPETPNPWRIPVGKINYGRVLIGGIAAGILLLAFDMIGISVLGFDMAAWATAHNLTEPSMAVWVISSLLFGLLTAWLYAAIRPRFGAGWKTAAITAAFVWAFFTVLYGTLTAWGLYTQAELLKFAAWGVIQVFAAAYAAAWLYKEA